VAKGWKQADLAKRMHVKANDVKQWEIGQSPSGRQIAQLNQLLGCTLPST